MSRPQGESSFPQILSRGVILIASAAFALAEPEVFKQATPIATLHPGIASRTLRVSADGQRIAYMATLEGGGEAVFVNDE